MRRLRILHISDLHERASFEGMPRSRRAVLELDAEERGIVLGEKFSDALSDVAKDGIDLVCFTGDLADWGHPNEYDAARDRVNAILATCHVPVSRFFAVPGNHDVQRSVQEDAWRTVKDWLGETQDRRALGRWLRDDKTPVGLDGKLRPQLLERTAEFWSCLRSLGRGDLVPHQPRFLGYRHTLSIGEVEGIDVAIHIVGLDSAWMCGGDDDQGRIVITDEQVLAHIRVGENSLDGLRIGLVHHPLDHLVDHHAVRRLLGDNGVDLLLHGHQHDPLSMDLVEPGASLRVVAAGCLMEGDRGKDWPNGFQLIEVDPTSLAGAIRFVKWVPGRRFWTPGTDLYENAANGVLPLAGAPGTGSKPDGLVQEDRGGQQDAFRHASGAGNLSTAPLSIGVLGAGASQPLVPSRLLAAPPPMLRACSARKRAVAAVINLVKDCHVVELVGPPGGGKTHLARLVVNELGVGGAWIPLRDQHVDVCVDALAHARVNLGRAPLMVVDDLPRVEGGSSLEGAIAHLAAAVVAAQGQLFLLSHFRLPVTSAEIFSYMCHDVPFLDHEEVAEYFDVLGAPEELRSEQNSEFVVQLTGGLPILVAAVARYLAARAWTFDTDALIALLEGAHAGDLRDEIVRRVLKTVTAEDARELLFRLMLVRRDFTDETIDVVCEVDPRVERPGEHMATLKDIWVEPTSSSSYQTATVLGVVHPNPLRREVRERTHEALGDMLFHQKTWTPALVSQAFRYYDSANKTGKAGTVLLMGLTAHFNEPEVRGDYGLLALWGGTFPEDVEPAMRLQVRAFQMGIGARLGRDVAEQVRDLKAALNEVHHRDTWAAATAGAAIGPRLTAWLPGVAADLMMVAIRSWAQAVNPLGARLSLPGDFPIEALPFFATIYVERPAHVEGVLETLRRLDRAEFDKALGYKHVSMAVFALTDRLVVTEQEKAPEDASWADVRSALGQVESCANDLGWTLLESRAVRADLLALAEHLNAPTDAREEAERRLATASSDELRFVLQEVIARTHLFAGDEERAAVPLRGALDVVPTGFEILGTFAQVDVGLAAKDAARAARHLREALIRSDNIEDLEPVNRARILGELALAEHGVAEWRSCFGAIDRAMVLVHDNWDDSREMITTGVTLWHLSAFLSLHARGPEQMPDGFEIPRQGIMFPRSTSAATLYNTLRRDNSFWIHAEHAEIVGEWEVASEWRRRAFDTIENEQSARFFTALSSVGELVANRNLDVAIDRMSAGELLDAERPVYSYVVPAMALLCAHERGDTWSLCAHALEHARQRFDDSPCAKMIDKCIAVLRTAASSPPRGTLLRLVQGDADEVAWGVAMLAESVHDDAEYAQALSYQLSAIIPLWGSMRQQSGVRSRLLQPFLLAFWERAVERSPFKFAAPRQVRADLGSLDDVRPRSRERRLMRTMLTSLTKGSLDPRVRAWLNED